MCVCVCVCVCDDSHTKEGVVGVVGVGVGRVQTGHFVEIGEFVSVGRCGLVGVARRFQTLNCLACVSDCQIPTIHSHIFLKVIKSTGEIKFLISYILSM